MLAKRNARVGVYVCLTIIILDLAAAVLNDLLGLLDSLVIILGYSLRSFLLVLMYVITFAFLELYACIFVSVRNR